MLLYKKHAKIKKLTPTVLHQFIDHINIHQAMKAEGRWIQQIDIFYNCVGKVDATSIAKTKPKDVNLQTRKGDLLELAKDEELRESRIASPREKMPDVAFYSAPILGFSATGVTRENGLEGLINSLSSLEEDPRQLMRNLYTGMLLDETGTAGFSRFFELLVQNEEGAVLWHCSAGKDRAGLASALLLTVLGVSREAILSDYLATNRYVAGRADDLRKIFPPHLQTEDFLESLHILNSADESFLAAGVRGIEEQYHSIDGYLSDALGVDEAVREHIRTRYLV